MEILLSNKKNEAYFEVTDILKGELFDDFNIFAREFDDILTPEQLPPWIVKSSFWSWYVRIFDDIEMFSTKCEEVGDREIIMIYIFNISQKDYTRFSQRLIELKERVEDFIGREIIIKSNKLDRDDDSFTFGYGHNVVDINGEMVPLSQIDDYWDFTIKIGKMI